MGAAAAVGASEVFGFCGSTTAGFSEEGIAAGAAVGADVCSAQEIFGDTHKIKIIHKIGIMLLSTFLGNN